MTRRAVRLLALLLLLAGPASAVGQPLAIRELAAEAPRILRELAALRGLPAPGPPPRVLIRTREERRRFVVREFQRKYPAGRLDAERRAMVSWGLIPADFDLGGFLADLVVEQAAAYYDPVAKVMILANWLGRDEQREALTHELVHLLQDRQIDLDRFLGVPSGRGDEALARQAVIEGEAVALTLDRGLRRQGQDVGQLPDVTALEQAIVGSTTGPVFGRAPRFLKSLLTFPYARGFGFVHQFRRRYGWAEFSRIYADPPRSTTQILHPGRYLERREDPVPVNLPDLGALLGGARRLLEDDAGEFGLAGILGEGLGEAASAAGWRGDRYAVYEEPAGGTVLVSLSLWESEAAASAFADAYGRLLARRPAPGPSRLSGAERRAGDVLIYDGLPSTAVEAVRAAVWTRR